MLTINWYETKSKKRKRIKSIVHSVSGSPFSLFTTEIYELFIEYNWTDYVYCIRRLNYTKKFNNTHVKSGVVSYKQAFDDKYIVKLFLDFLNEQIK